MPRIEFHGLGPDSHGSQLWIEKLKIALLSDPVVSQFNSKTIYGFIDGGMWTDVETGERYTVAVVYSKSAEYLIHIKPVLQESGLVHKVILVPTLDPDNIKQMPREYNEELERLEGLSEPQDTKKC